MTENFRTQKKTEQTFMHIRKKRNASFHINRAWLCGDENDVKAGCAVIVSCFKPDAGLIKIRVIQKVNNLMGKILSH